VIRVALKGLIQRKLRALLTALAVVLGVATIRRHLRQIDPGLREILPEVASTDAAVPQLRGVDRHGTRISRPTSLLPLDRPSDGWHDRGRLALEGARSG